MVTITVYSFVEILRSNYAISAPTVMRGRPIQPICMKRHSDNKCIRFSAVEMRKKRKQVIPAGQGCRRFHKNVANLEAACL